MEVRKEINLNFSGNLKDLAYLEAPFHRYTFKKGEFYIDFKNNRIILNIMELAEKISLRISKEDMEYLKKEIENGAIIKTLNILYKESKDKWSLQIFLRKKNKGITKEDFKNIKRIAVIGIYLDYRKNSEYSILIWDKNNDTIEHVKSGFLLRHKEDKIWIENITKNIIDIALNSIKEYNCEISMISFEKFEKKEGAKILKKMIIKNIFTKSVWEYPLKILAYMPISNQNQKRLKKIYIDVKDISNNENFNISKNIAKRTIEYFKMKLS